MKTNLLEAAAEVLNKSKSSAPAEAMHKAEGEVEDLGGDTPQKHQENNPDATTKTPRAKAPGASPRVGAMPMQKLAKEEKEDEDEDSEEDKAEDKAEKENMKEANWKSMKEEVELMFSEENLSEEFKGKVATIFEARVNDRISQIQEELEAQFAESFEEVVEQFTVEMTEKVNDYLNYVVEEWMSENEIAIEKGLRTELTEDFMVGLRNLFAENYIDIPDEKVNVVEELSEKVLELEEKLNEEIQNSIELTKELNESKRIGAIHEVTKGLTDTQVEKVKSLAESVEFTTEEEYLDKLEIIKENYFPSNVKRSSEAYLQETIEEEQSDSVKISDPRMAAYFNSISRTLPR